MFPDEASKIIEDYICNDPQNQKGLSIHSLMKSLCFFELMYSIIVERYHCKTNPDENSIYASQLMRNFVSAGYFNSQINNLSKLLDSDKRCRSLWRLWEETKSKLPKDDLHKQIKSYFNDLSKNKNMIKVKNFRDKMICHNDKDCDLNGTIDIQKSAQEVFEIYKYFNSFISHGDFDFLDICDINIYDEELEILKRPFIKTKEDEEDFKNRWEQGLANFNLKLLSEFEQQKIAERHIKITIKTT